MEAYQVKIESGTWSCTSCCLLYRVFSTWCLLKLSFCCKYTLDIILLILLTGWHCFYYYGALSLALSCTPFVTLLPRRRYNSIVSDGICIWYSSKQNFIILLEYGNELRLIPDCGSDCITWRFKSLSLCVVSSLEELSDEAIQISFYWLRLTLTLPL